MLSTIDSRIFSPICLALSTLMMLSAVIPLAMFINAIVLYKRISFSWKVDEVQCIPYISQLPCFCNIFVLITGTHIYWQWRWHTSHIQLSCFCHICGDSVNCFCFVCFITTCICLTLICIFSWCWDILYIMQQNCIQGHKWPRIALDTASPVIMWVTACVPAYTTSSSSWRLEPAIKWPMLPKKLICIYGIPQGEELFD